MVFLIRCSILVVHRSILVVHRSILVVHRSIPVVSVSYNSINLCTHLTSAATDYKRLIAWLDALQQKIAHNELVQVI